MVLYAYRALVLLAALAGSVIGSAAEHADQKAHTPHVELRATSMPSQSGSIKVHTKKDFAPKTGKANAAFIILARNSNQAGLLSSMQQNEDKFNSNYNYPYVILNDQPFTDEFMQVISSVTKAQVKFGTIDHSMWGYPQWIDQEKAAKGRKALEEKKAPYASSESYRHMCRFQSGFFFRHPLTMEYDYYWRIEPDVNFYCNIDYDVFAFMEAKDLKYGWTLSLTDYPSTLETFWPTVQKWISKHPEWMTSGKSSLRPWLHDDDKMEKYNLCHFWSNFEIGSLKWLRSEQYVSYFDHLDKSGGFFYERWGDAPVHSVAVALMLNESDVHFFNDIGYQHPPLTHCPSEPQLQAKCTCNGSESFESNSWSCGHRLKKLFPDYTWSMEKYNMEIEPFQHK
ncbi:hypothetical protein INT43_005000 [Umbelopsis isabellina]|uniref:Uncharacterized protein n=1 Tax=Mortierella isabellina TaxID=91625 RepID=A0A8H7PGK4_MORIS|nr:hypothetical protein INT43_005000 [Umbelopsis isabellina]